MSPSLGSRQGPPGASGTFQEPDSVRGLYPRVSRGLQGPAGAWGLQGPGACRGLRPGRWFGTGIRFFLLLAD